MEVIIAVTFVGFLTGFVAVLCIGNYYRAKRAMERQRQRRLERLARIGSTGGPPSGENGSLESPRSHYSGISSVHSDGEKQHLLSGQRQKPQQRRTQVLDSQQSSRQSWGYDRGGQAPLPVSLEDSKYIDIGGGAGEGMGGNNGLTYRTQQLNPNRRRQQQQSPLLEEESEVLHSQVGDYHPKGAASDVMSI